MTLYGPRAIQYTFSIHVLYKGWKRKGNILEEAQSFFAVVHPAPLTALLA
jgi:hypothetical protein